MRAHVLDAFGVIVNTVMTDRLGDNMVDADVVGGGPGDSVVNGALVPKSPQVVTAPTFAQLKAEYLDEVREMREKVLVRLNGYGSMLYLGEPPELPDEKLLCRDLIQGLLDITTIDEVESATTIAAVKLAVKAEWARLVALANTSSPNLVKAFRKVDE
jgi:hypothetical protein